MVQSQRTLGPQRTNGSVKPDRAFGAQRTHRSDWTQWTNGPIGSDWADQSDWTYEPDEPHGTDWTDESYGTDRANRADLQPQRNLGTNRTVGTHRAGTTGLQLR